MKRLAIYSHVAKSTVWELMIYDRLQTLRHSTTRNRLAAEIVFVSYGMLLMLSGYKANIESCNLI
jgi:hypothetical protein